MEPIKIQRDLEEFKNLGLVKIISNSFSDTDLFITQEINLSTIKTNRLVCDPKKIKEDYLNSVFEDYIQENTEKRKLPLRNAVLYADVDVDVENEQESLDSGKWAYCSFRNKHKKIYDIQNWVRRVDGKYSALFLYCDNPAAWTLSSKKSAIIHPADEEDIKTCFENGEHPQIALFIPGKGYVD